MPKTKGKPADPFTQVMEWLAPMASQFTEIIRLWAGVQPVVERIADAQQAKTGIELSADEVKSLCLLLTQLGGQGSKP